MNNKQRFRGSTSTFLVQLDFGNVGFRSREGKAGVYVPRKNVSEQRREPHMATMPGFKLGSHWWEMGALTTASSLDPLPFYTYIIYLYIWSYRYRSHRPPRHLYILENLFQQPLHRRVPIDLFPCYTQRGSTWTVLVLECSASLLYLEEFQSSCMFLSPLGDLLLRLLRSSKPMFKWVNREVLCPPNGSINVNWGLLFGWILKTSLTRQESIVMHLSGS